MRTQRIGPACAAAVTGCLLLLLAPAVVRAQPVTPTQYAVVPTAGLALPLTGLAGGEDALAVSANPAELYFMNGWDLNLAIDTSAPDEDKATAPGAGWGLFAATRVGGGVLPHLGWGMALEFLNPPRVALSPDPGSPTRYTWAVALPLGRLAALGVSWHHFFDDSGQPLHGLNTWDMGLSMRLGAHLAAGAVVRDLTQPDVAGVPVERRYELELALRPTGDDRLELGLGGRLGEIRTDFESGADIDGWLRASWRVTRGLYLRAQVDNRSLIALSPGPSGAPTSTQREWRISGGLDLSFGSTGVATYATGAFTNGGDGRLAGGTLVARVSQAAVPSVLGRRRRIERIDLEGDLGERDLTDLVAQLHLDRRDPSLVAVVVQVDGLEAGWDAIDEVRDELAALKQHGVKIYVYAVAGTTKQYYLASVADKVFVDPAGGLYLSGMAGTTLYFKGLFDKLGVLAQFSKIEEYKSAPEAYTRAGPTEPALIMHNELYDSMYEHVVQGIASGRHLTPDRVRVLIDNGPYTAGELAKIPELVDAVVDPDQLSDALIKDLGRSYPVEDAPLEREPRWDYPAIAIIYIDGDIVDGKSSVIPLLGTQLVGGDTIASSIAAARADSRVKAIILRINSPGGSALASEVISREVFKTRGVKPIICSMGDVAASGGYYSAAGCDTILAGPMTITGSIGIFNGKFDFSGLAHRLGITWTTYKRGTEADMNSLFRKFDPAEMKMMKRKLHYYYGRFIQAVAKGRGITTDQVNEVGRGHVWTGAQAKPIKLIDQFGGLGDAIELAKQRTGLSRDARVQLVLLPRPTESLVSKLLGGLVHAKADAEEGAAGALLRAALPAGAGRLLEAIPGSVWAEPTVPQARLPFALVPGD